MALQRNLARILTVSNSNEQLSQFQLLFNEVVQTGTLEDIKTIAMKLIGDIPNPQLCRTVVTEFSSSLQSCPEAIIEEAHVFLLPLIKNQNIPFDEADYILRTTLFTYYIKAESFSQAASTLSELNLDSSVKVYSESEKADILIKCAGKNFQRSTVLICCIIYYFVNAILFVVESVSEIIALFFLRIQAYLFGQLLLESIQDFTCYF